LPAITLFSAIQVMTVALAMLALHVTAPRANALERLCDPSFENCRNDIITRIRAEAVGIDVGTWFFEDSRFTDWRGERDCVKVGARYKTGRIHAHGNLSRSHTDGGTDRQPRSRM
jgi:hypothetical protein